MERFERENREVMARYLTDIRGIARSGRGEEQTLAAPARSGRRDAVERLVVSNLSLVVKIAKSYRGYGLSVEDLVGEGNIGLIEAARRYQEGRGTRFGTYAAWWIRKRLRIALREQPGVVQYPENRSARIRAFRAAEHALRGTLGRHPDRAEVSRSLSIDAAAVDRLLESRPRRLSLDAGPRDATQRPLRELLPDPRCASAESGLISEESVRLLGRAFELLSRQERAVVAWRIGFADSRPLTLREIGERLRLSRERVRQIEQQAHERLRRLYDEHAAVRCWHRPGHRRGTPRDRGGEAGSTGSGLGSRR